MAQAIEKEADYDQLVKVIVVGPSGVGKTALVNKLTGKLFPHTHELTVGVSLQATTLEKEDKKYRFQIWDTPGKKKFLAPTQILYKDVKAILLVWDGQNPATLDALENYFQDIPENSSVIFIRNKIDEAREEISDEETGKIASYVQKYPSKIKNHAIVEISAKLKTGFSKLKDELFKMLQPEAEQQPAQPAVPQPPQEPTSGCCAFFRNPNKQMAVGAAIGGAGFLLSLTAEPVTQWLCGALLATTAPPAVVTALIVAGLLVLTAGVALVIHGDIQRQNNNAAAAGN